MVCSVTAMIVSAGEKVETARGNLRAASVSGADAAVAQDIGEEINSGLGSW